MVHWLFAASDILVDFTGEQDIDAVAALYSFPGAPADGPPVCSLACRDITKVCDTLMFWCVPYEKIPAAFLVWFLYHPEIEYPSSFVYAPKLAVYKSPIFIEFTGQKITPSTHPTPCRRRTNLFLTACRHDDVTVGKLFVNKKMRHSILRSFLIFCAQSHTAACLCFLPLFLAQPSLYQCTNEHLTYVAQTGHLSSVLLLEEVLGYCCWSNVLSIAIQYKRLPLFEYAMQKINEDAWTQNGERCRTSFIITYNDWNFMAIRGQFEMMRQAIEYTTIPTFVHSIPFVSNPIDLLLTYASTHNSPLVYQTIVLLRENGVPYTNDTYLHAVTSKNKQLVAYMNGTGCARFSNARTFAIQYNLHWLLPLIPKGLPELLPNVIRTHCYHVYRRHTNFSMG